MKNVCKKKFKLIISSILILVSPLLGVQLSNALPYLSRQWILTEADLASSKEVCSISIMLIVFLWYISFNEKNES
nr:hypothetical protein [uncultured Aminipila sp.]